MGAIEEVVDALVHGLSVVFVKATERRTSSNTRCDIAHLPVKDVLQAVEYPVLQFRCFLLVEGLPRLPEVLEGVDEVEPDRDLDTRLLGRLLGSFLQVVITIYQDDPPLASSRISLLGFVKGVPDDILR